MNNLPLQGGFPPCPFCGSDQIQGCYDGNNLAKSFGRCRSCGASAPIARWAALTPKLTLAGGNAITELKTGTFLRICELPDRTPPEDEPEAVTMTLEEFKGCIDATLEDLVARRLVHIRREYPTSDH